MLNSCGYGLVGFIIGIMVSGGASSLSFNFLCLSLMDCTTLGIGFTAMKILMHMTHRINPITESVIIFSTLVQENMVPILLSCFSDITMFDSEFDCAS